MLNQIQKSPDLHIHSIPGLQAQPVEQPCSCRGREFNVLNMREQPPGHCICSTASCSLLGCFFQAKINMPSTLQTTSHSTLTEKWDFFSCSWWFRDYGDNTLIIFQYKCDVALSKSNGNQAWKSSALLHRQVQKIHRTHPEFTEPGRASQGENQVWPWNLKNNLIYMLGRMRLAAKIILKKCSSSIQKLKSIF